MLPISATFGHKFKNPSFALASELYDALLIMKMKQAEQMGKGAHRVMA